MSSPQLPVRFAVCGFTQQAPRPRGAPLPATELRAATRRNTGFDLETHVSTHRRHGCTGIMK